MLASTLKNLGRWFAVMAASAALAVPALATTYDWDPLFGTTGDFAASFNWTPAGAPPVAGDIARFNLGAASTAMFGASPTNAVLQHQSGDTIFHPSSVFATYTLTAASTITGGTLTVDPSGIFRLDLDFTSLSLSGGSSFTVNGGDVSNSAALNVGNNSAATMVLDGSTTTYTNTSTVQSTLGFSSGSGSLTFSDEATGTFAGSLRIGGAASASGDLEVLGGSTLSFTDANIGNGTAVGQTGTVLVEGSGSTITQTGASILNLGKAADGVASITVQDGGVYNTGTGLTTVNPTGSININGNLVFARFNANGDVNVDGGSIALNGSAATFDLAAGRTLTATDSAQIDLGSSPTLSDGTTWDIQSGADLFSSSSMNIGTGGVTNVTIDGVGSSLTRTTGSTTSFWGSDGGTAEITVRNGALVNVGGISLARSSTAGTTGILAVESGATMTTQILSVATLGGATTSGEITVTGSGSTLTQSGSSSLTLGQSSSGSATLNVLGEGTFNTGTGTTTVNATGSINIGAGGTGGAFNANGDVNVNGGSITRASGSFNLVSGRTLTASNGAQIDLDFAPTIAGGTTWNITSGADLFSSGFMDLGNSGGVTILTVDGTGSSLTTGSSAISNWGNNGQTAEVTVRNGASANTGSVRLGWPTAGSTGILAVESGATMTTLTLSVANFGGTGTVTVTGAGSLLTQTGSSTLTLLGHESSGTATLNVLDGGTFTAGAGGTVLRATGTVNIDGGFANLGPLDEQGGAVNFNSGSLSYGGDLTVSIGGLLGSDLTLASNSQLALTGTTTIDAFRSLTIDGGTLSTGALAGDGQLVFNSGKLVFTGAAGLTIGPGGPLGDRLELKPGATIEATEGIVNQGLITGNGTLVGTLANAAAGEVRAEAGNTLFFDGAGHSNSGDVRLAGGWAEFGGTLANAADGNITGRGTLSTGGLTNQGDLALSNGVTDVYGDVNNETTGRVIVSGHADVTFWDDVTHLGAMFSVSTGSSATFFGTAGFGVSGGGDVFFEADVTPGSSPGLEEFGGNVSFGALAELNIELAGTTKGAQYDALAVAGATTLDGALNVSLLGGFNPMAGDTFELLTAAAIDGAFSSVALPSLADGLDWYLDYESNAVTLSVVPLFTADFDQDGDVDGDDLAQWRGDFGVNDLSDADDDGDSDGADFLAWQRQLGSPAPATAATGAVPEPRTPLLLGFAALVLGIHLRTALRQPCPQINFKPPEKHPR